MSNNSLLRNAVLTTGLIAGSAAAAQELENCSVHHPELYGSTQFDVISTSFNDATGVYSINVHMRELENNHPVLAEEIQNSPMLGSESNYSSVLWYTESNAVQLKETPEDRNPRNLTEHVYAHSSDRTATVKAEVNTGYTSLSNPFISPEIDITTVFNHERNNINVDMMTVRIGTYPDFNIDTETGLTIHNGTEIDIRFGRRFKDRNGMTATPYVFCDSKETISVGGSHIRAFEINFE